MWKDLITVFSYYEISDFEKIWLPFSPIIRLNFFSGGNLVLKQGRFYIKSPFTF